MGSFAGLLTVLLALFTRGSSKKPITCDAGQFTAGQTAYVTCNFHKIIKDSGHRIFVLHYPFSASKNFSGETVLKCTDLYLQNPHCIVAEGYELNNEITDQLSLRIPEVKKTFAGRYVCQIVPPGGRRMNTCKLTVHGTISTSTTADTTRPDTDSKTLNKLDLGFHIGLSIIIVALLCTIVFLAVTIRKLKRTHPMYQKPKQLSDFEMQKMTEHFINQTESSVEEILENARELPTPHQDVPQPDSAYNTLTI